MKTTHLAKKSEMWEILSKNKKPENDFLSPTKATTNGIGLGKYSEEEYIQKFRDWVERYQKTIEAKDLVDYPEPEVGHPLIVEHNGFCGSVPYIKNFALAKHVCKLIDIPKPKILEIGAGYGGMAEILLRLMPIQSYTCVDLQEVLPLQKYYLSNTHPASALEFKTPENIGDDYYDVVINTMSFGEMPSDVAKAYVKWAMTHSKMLISHNSIRRTPSGVRSHSEYGFHNYHIEKILAQPDVAGAFHDQHLLLVVKNGEPNISADTLDRFQTYVSLGLHEDFDCKNYDAMDSMFYAAQAILFRKKHLLDFLEKGKSTLARAYSARLLDKPIDAPEYIKREILRLPKRHIIKRMRQAL